MIRRFRRIFRSPATKNEPIHPTSNNSDSTPDNVPQNKQRSSSATNHLYTGREKKTTILLYICVFFLYLT
jgi:hypothetical protein